MTPLWVQINIKVRKHHTGVYTLIQTIVVLVILVTSPPKPNLCRPRRGGGAVLGRRTGLWSTAAKMWAIVPKPAWHWGGDSSATNDPFGAPGSTPSYVCLPLAWGSVDGDFNSPVLVGLIWTTKNLQEKVAKPMKRSLAIQAQMTTLFVGGAIWQLKQPHTSCECVALAAFRFRRLGEHFYWTQATMMRFRYVRQIRYFVRGTGLLAE
jgi:hypothetical protein